MAHWQAAGFCHGVMNTDNMSILGLTIDYGPFQFLDAYDPGHICNHSDSQGRYAFDQQPGIAQWNLYALARALMALIRDQDLALQALATFKPLFSQTFHSLMCAKLGWSATSKAAALPASASLIADLLALLKQDRVDYTIFWHRLGLVVLGSDTTALHDLFVNRAELAAWMLRYSELSLLYGQAPEADLMLKTNPKFVLRNYLAEQAIESAQARDFSGVATLLGLLEKPFDPHPAHVALAGLPPDWARQIQVSCSS
ncbi:hypothetical protein GALL_491590 [mine drainage metagenome]|uniref:Uncharacterized protein n=1 Tax=mine drainage metagenome TaxID=410659 RepID=A0A1J5PNT4_9ZZZZ